MRQHLQALAGDVRRHWPYYTAATVPAAAFAIITKSILGAGGLAMVATLLACGVVSWLIQTDEEA